MHPELRRLRRLQRLEQVRAIAKQAAAQDAALAEIPLSPATKLPSWRSAKPLAATARTS